MKRNGETTIKTIREVLTAARALLDERGWAQSKYQSRDGRVCAAEAILLAMRRLHGGEESRAALGQRAIVEFEKAAGTDSIMRWNDDPNRTRDEVRGVFTQSILAQHKGA